MEKHKRIGSKAFVSLVPHLRGKHVIQVSYGSSKSFFRGRTPPMDYKSALRKFKRTRTKEKVVEIMMKNPMDD